MSKDVQVPATEQVTDAALAKALAAFDNLRPDQKAELLSKRGITNADERGKRESHGYESGKRYRITECKCADCSKSLGVKSHVGMICQANEVPAGGYFATEGRTHLGIYLHAPIGREQILRDKEGKETGRVTKQHLLIPYRVKSFAKLHKVVPISDDKVKGN